MKLSKIHRVFSFKQSPWLKSYICFNTDKRKQARNDFEKDFYKMMNNSVFGKTMENLRKRVKVELTNNQKRAIKVSVKPSFQGFCIFNEDLMGVNMKIEKLYLNRPIYVGFFILGISKTLMYEFHFNHIKVLITERTLYRLTHAVLSWRCNDYSTYIPLNTFLSTVRTQNLQLNLRAWTNACIF